VRTYRAPKPQARALFGKAVAVIGDLDRSGYNGKIEQDRTSSDSLVNIR
jgi:hypothetical protein